MWKIADKICQVFTYIYDRDLLGLFYMIYMSLPFCSFTILFEDDILYVYKVIVLIGIIFNSLLMIIQVLSVFYLSKFSKKD